MSDSFSIDMRNRWPLAKALAYVKDLPQPKQPSLTWLIEQMPEGVVIEFPRITETYRDLNAPKDLRFDKLLENDLTE